jgi:hypothetical protein
MEIYTGALPDPIDIRDYHYDIPLGASPIDWVKGYDIEKELSFTLPSKNQFQSLSCVGQAWAYYIGALNKLETGKYDECSAKSIYSQIFLHSGGAYIRDGATLAVDWGALFEAILKSYKADGTTDESFMRDLSWLKPEMDKLAKVLQAKDYRVMQTSDMEVMATAIRDNHGVVGGLYGDNNGTWFSAEPKPPTRKDWAHAMYFGKFRIKNGKKQVGGKQSWGDVGENGWQWFGEEWFGAGLMFNPWTLTDKPNQIIDENMIFYKEKGNSAVYQLGKDGKHYPINSGETFKRLYGEFADNKIIEKDSLNPKGERLGLVI